MNTQWLLFCSNVWKSPPTAPHPPAHPLYTESRILVRPEKKCVKFQQHQLASYSSYKILAIQLLYLYSGSGVHALRHQVVTAYWIFKIGISRNTKCAIMSGFCRSGHIWVVNFEGFRGFHGFLPSTKINHIISAQATEFSADPQKYKPTNSLCFGYPWNFKPLKLNTLVNGLKFDLLYLHIYCISTGL